MKLKDMMPTFSTWQFTVTVYCRHILIATKKLFIMALMEFAYEQELNSIKNKVSPGNKSKEKSWIY